VNWQQYLFITTDCKHIEKRYNLLIAVSASFLYIAAPKSLKKEWDMTWAGVVPMKNNRFDGGLESLDLAQHNRALRDGSPQDIIRWALDLEQPLIATTSFSPNSAVMLHQLVRVRPDLQLVWVDSGYNTRDTYLIAEQLIADLGLNLTIFTPTMSAARRDALIGVPMPGEDEALHREFTRQVKLEPFERALQAFQPSIWISGIRREETAFRKTLDILSWDSRSILKVAPIFYWTEADVQSYMAEHQLPTCRKYFDPTKVADNRECGLHTGA
jgi:phosphoadenosine phosphosulfate reductase